MLGAVDNNAWNALIVGLVCLIASPLVYRFWPALQREVNGEYFKKHRARAQFTRLLGAWFICVVGLIALIGAIIRLS
jgi:hypothetical protein